MLLRIVNNPSENEEVNLPVDFHIHKRFDQIIYKSYVDDLAVPLAYLDSTDIHAKINLALIDRSEFLPENTFKRMFLKNNYDLVSGVSSYSTTYPDILITDRIIKDSRGLVIPLFQAHELPSDTTVVKIVQVTNTHTRQLDHGYLIDTSLNKVYFNFKNTFDPITGNYELYYITSTSADGTIVKGLINPTPAIREAAWEDIDPDTGDLNDDFIFYSREQNSLGYTYYFNKNGTYYIKPQDTSLISPIGFANGLSISGWFPRFTTGEFKHTDLNGIVRNYRVPEYDDLSFYPSKPYFFDSSAEAIQVNNRVIFIGRGNLAINQDDRYLEIIIEDSNDVPIYALTTKTSKDGTKYIDDTNWSKDEIASWDNHTGFIELTIELRSEWNINISYYYVVKELQYLYTNLNPLHNDLVYNHYHVYYVKPDATNRSIHHLVVRNDGIIVECSDNAFKLLDEDGIYNPSTFIGMVYRTSSRDTYRPDDWVKLYSVEGDNVYQYLILAEYFFIEKRHPDFIEHVNVTRPGNVLNPKNIDDAVARAPQLFHSEYAATSAGFEYPQNNAYILRLSYSLLEDYGGTFTTTTLVESLRKFVATGKYLLFEWDEDIRDLSIDNTVSNKITLTWSRIAPGWCYRIERSIILDGDYSEVGYLCSDYSEITFTDSELVSGTVYYYRIVPVLDDIDFPVSYSIGAEVE